MKFSEVEFLRSIGFAKELNEFKGLEVVFVGRSNVGKSSIINRLFGRKSLAKVSSVPGKTATVNFYVSRGVYFVDLPGYGYAKVGKCERKRFSSLIEEYFSKRRKIAVVVLVVDFFVGFSFLDLQMAEFLIEVNLPFVVVLNKADKVKKGKRDVCLNRIYACLKNFDGDCLIEFSAKSGEGVERLRMLIEKYCEI